jgi:kynurenine 3-monooxygenase
VRTTVIEPALSTEQWVASRSHSINLNERGLTALSAAGVLEAVSAVAVERHVVAIHSPDGSAAIIPRNPPHLALSRPALVDCLAGCLVDCLHITLVKGASVVGYEAIDDGSLRVGLDDGTKLRATHIVAADGKWSAVRAAFLEDRRSHLGDDEPSDACALRSVPSWGIFLPPLASVPTGWRTDATHVFKPASPDAAFYAIASPLPSGECSVSLVFFDAVLESKPWLEPRGDESASTDTGWMEAPASRSDARAGERTLSASLAALLATELPALASELDGDALARARVGRRGAWLALAGHYASADGRAALVGDAAHAMPASLGEGANCALESAAALLAALPGTGEGLRVAFAEYGRRRPAAARPVQLRSVATGSGPAAGRGKKGE